jgi:hypothetical protein
MPVTYICDKCGSEKDQHCDQRFSVGKRYFFHTTTYYFVGVVSKEMDFHIDLDDAAILRPPEDRPRLKDFIDCIEESWLTPTKALSIAKMAIMAAFEIALDVPKAPVVALSRGLEP